MQCCGVMDSRSTFYHPGVRITYNFGYAGAEGEFEEGDTISAWLRFGLEGGMKQGKLKLGDTCTCTTYILLLFCMAAHTHHDIALLLKFKHILALSSC